MSDAAKRDPRVTTNEHNPENWNSATEPFAEVQNRQDTQTLVTSSVVGDLTREVLTELNLRCRLVTSSVGLGMLSVLGLDFVTM